MSGCGARSELAGTTPRLLASSADPGIMPGSRAGDTRLALGLPGRGGSGSSSGCFTSTMPNGVGMRASWLRWLM